MKVIEERKSVRTLKFVFTLFELEEKLELEGISRVWFSKETQEIVVETIAEESSVHDITQEYVLTE